MDKKNGNEKNKKNKKNMKNKKNEIIALYRASPKRNVHNSAFELLVKSNHPQRWRASLPPRISSRGPSAAINSEISFHKLAHDRQATYY